MDCLLSITGIYMSALSKGLAKLELYCKIYPCSSCRESVMVKQMTLGILGQGVEINNFVWGNMESVTTGTV